MRGNSEHLLAGAALPVLTDPLAFGEAGRRYALATAGAALDLGEESLSDQDGEEEEESSAEESPRSSRGSEGGESCRRRSRRLRRNRPRRWTGSVENAPGGDAKLGKSPRTCARDKRARELKKSATSRPKTSGQGKGSKKPEQTQENAKPTASQEKSGWSCSQSK